MKILEQLSCTCVLQGSIFTTLLASGVPEHMASTTSVFSVILVQQLHKKPWAPDCILIVTLADNSSDLGHKGLSVEISCRVVVCQLTDYSFFHSQRCQCINAWRRNQRSQTWSNRQRFTSSFHRIQWRKKWILWPLYQGHKRISFSVNDLKQEWTMMIISCE